MSPTRRLLLIDDDEHLGPPLAAWLARHGFTLDCALTPADGLARLHRGGYDAALLDVMLPGMDGFELCRRIRADAPPLRDLPLLMLTARGDVMDRVVGLELGADDYLPKPFEPRELLARLHTVLRRTQAAGAQAEAALAAAAAAPHVLAFEGLTLDLDRREVTRQGSVLELTGTEFELLALLAGQPRKVFSRDQILERLRGQAAEDLLTRAVDILISRLRKKLEPLDCIRTLRNVGYAFAAAPLNSPPAPTPAP